MFIPYSVLTFFLFLLCRLSWIRSLQTRRHWLSIKEETGNGQWNWGTRTGVGNGNTILVGKVFQLHSNFHLKAHFLSLVPPFTEFITKSVKREICLYVEIFNRFFMGNLFGSWIMFYKGSQSYESQYLPKGSFTQLASHF